ncbi:hypothetical protein SO802_022393 [Lithocarpus litseifolius]|uniref:Uncharacterized protein n=1 Tax=Lithocarpus litseifolius TaxID=425828 RepID=A0AAW2CHT8_9ROSI
MGRSKDRFWHYVQDLDGRFKRNFCGHDFAGGAMRIKAHLAGYKGRDIQICEKVTTDVREEACLAIKWVDQGVDKQVNRASTSRTATNGKKLVEKFQSIEEKLHDMQRELQNFQSQTIGALERWDFSKKPSNSSKEIEDHLMNDIV